MKTIEEQWNIFVDQVYGGVSKDQEEDMKLCFYSGAFILMKLNIEIDEDKTASEEEGVEALANVHKELLKFFNDHIKRGLGLPRG